jgi:D-aminoacyl-tRNA deacylase
VKAVIQRVSEACVTVDGKGVARIGRGLVTLLGVAKGDTEGAASRLVEKILNLRIFEDEAGKMNRSLIDIGGEHLIISQFTLAGDCSSGRRPSFTTAEAPAEAHRLYEFAVRESRRLGVEAKTGVFQADMKVALVNDGPVTFVLEVL